MKIATWNIDRLKDKKKLIPISDQILEINADILILTEANKLIDLSIYKFQTETQILPIEPFNYKSEERRVTIFSKYPILRTFATYDDLTSCCAEIQTDFGNIMIYGTIVGITGKNDKNFNLDLDNQISDINRLSPLGNFCFAGDLNISFSDSYYFTKNGRTKFNICFTANKLQNLTESISENVDHIVVSKNFIKDLYIQLSEWNLDKSLSDHKGVCVEMLENETAYNRR